FGAVIAGGGTVEDVIARFARPDGPSHQRAALEAARLAPVLEDGDLYPDVRPVLGWLRRRGVAVGVAGNQPAAVGEQLRDLHLPADIVAVSAELGSAKPDPRFFAGLVDRIGCSPGAVVYVGDQLDNDVLAAQACGLRAVRVLTGPWGALVRDPAIEATCVAVIDTLAALPGVLAPLLAGQELPDHGRA
ncbi:MAG: HAD family hydrolase, partial [Jatrophihabitans sp.]